MILYRLIPNAFAALIRKPAIEFDQGRFSNCGLNSY